MHANSRKRIRNPIRKRFTASRRRLSQSSVRAMDMIPIFLTCAESKYLALVIPDNQLLNRSLRRILSIARQTLVVGAAFIHDFAGGLHGGRIMTRPSSLAFASPDGCSHLTVRRTREPSITVAFFADF